MEQWSDGGCESPAEIKEEGREEGKRPTEDGDSKRGSSLGPSELQPNCPGGLETGSKCLAERVSDHNGSFRPVRGKRYGYQEEVSRPLVGKNLSLQFESLHEFD